ncbi:phage portal protein [Kribbella catacumbae]|uniref:phage portal protein n=1 Tax=Kribbella catacumbae TaxID=460086 RepID=UPI00058FC10F|nr:phage portal protein [Kribbella catacumbae]
MRWPWSRPVEERSSWSISDPAMAAFFSVGPQNLAGVPVNETTALGLSAVWRSVSLISGTIASVPLKTLRDKAGLREQVPSFLDNPGGPDGPTAFEWVETVLAHLVIHGNAYLAHVWNQAGALVGLVPLHPLGVAPEWEKVDGKPTGRKVFKATLDDGVRTFTQAEMTQIMALSLDGLKGLSPITVARHSLGTAIAGDRAAARMFGNGAMVSGLVTPEEDVTEDEAKTIKEGLKAKVSGVDNAGDIAVVNRKLKFTQWSTSNADAQFLESRQFSIEEVARWYGIPPFELMQTEKQTSWGTGIDSQQRGLARTVLSPWGQRFEQRLSRLLPKNQFAEFDFAGLERANPEDEIRLLLEQVAGGLLTVNEARAIRNLPPLPEAAPEPTETPEVAA